MEAHEFLFAIIVIHYHGHCKSSVDQQSMKHVQHFDKLIYTLSDELEFIWAVTLRTLTLRRPWEEGTPELRI